MRFIVDIYRYVILGVIAAATVSIVFVAMELGTAPQLHPQFGWYFLLGGSFLLLCLVMLLGITATFISIHDRHIELVEQLRRMNEGLEDHL